MRHFWLTGLSVLIIAAYAACGDPFGLGPPIFENTVETVELYALRGTAVNLPSAYSITFASEPVRVDQADETRLFDFALDIDSAHRVVLLTTGALELGRGSGAQVVDAPFDSIRIAPDRSYELDSALTLEIGDVAVVHSRPTDCRVFINAAYFFYAKLQILAVDTTARRIDFQLLVNRNCAYRGLEPGLPSR